MAELGEHARQRPHLQLVAGLGSVQTARSSRVRGRRAPPGRGRGADLSVDVVQMGPDGAGGQLHLGGDLLVDLALGEPAKGVDLAPREGTGLAPSLARRAGMRELVDELAKPGVAEPAGFGREARRIARDQVARGVVGDEVAEPHGGREARRRIGVMALDRAGDHVRQAPAASEHAADDGVVDPELAALERRPLLGSGLAVGEDLLVAGIEPHQDQLADVVEQGRGRQLVAAGDVSEVREALRGVAGRDRVAAEPLRQARPAAEAAEELVGLEGLRDRGNSGGRQRLDRVGDVGDSPPRAAAVVGGLHHRDRDRGVGLDQLGDLGQRRRLVGGQLGDPGRRLGERRKRGHGVESSRQALASLTDGPGRRGLLDLLCDCHFGVGAPALRFAAVRP